MRRRSRPLLHLAVLGVAAVVLGPAVEASLRGLDPAHASRYSGTGGTFTCLDGSKSIPFASVNDDYCHCKDGSDEPGTSACHNGKFYCVNKGHEPRLLSATFVDDGVCDCCDGSDERSGCSNTCLAQHAETKKKLQAEVDQAARSLARRTELLEQAKTKPSEWTARLGNIDAEIVAKQAEIEELKRKASEEEEERDRRAAERAAKAAEEARAAEEKAVAEEAAKAAADAAGGEGGQSGDAAAADQQQASGDVPHEETAEERGRRIAAQWTHDPEAAGAPAQGAEGQVDEGSDSHDHDHEHHDHDHEHHDHDHGHYDHHDHGDYTYPPEPVDELDPNHPNSAAYKAKEALKDLDRLTFDKSNLQHWTGANLDFGPGNIFAALAGRCFSDNGQRFKYEACVFGHATQSEPHNVANRVSLGHWVGFRDNYKTMVFQNGDPCAAPHPARSFAVHMLCAEEERMYDAGEPQTCVYEATLATPLACSEQQHQEALRKLQQHDEWEKAILAEIEAEEQQRKAASQAKDEL